MTPLFKIPPHIGEVTHFFVDEEKVRPFILLSLDYETMLASGFLLLNLMTDRRLAWPYKNLFYNAQFDKHMHFIENISKGNLVGQWNFRKEPTFEVVNVTLKSDEDAQ